MGTAGISKYEIIGVPITGWSEETSTVKSKSLSPEEKLTILYNFRHILDGFSNLLISDFYKRNPGKLNQNDARFISNLFAIKKAKLKTLAKKELGR